MGGEDYSKLVVVRRERGLCLREDFLLDVLDVGGRDAEAVQQALVVVLFVHGVCSPSAPRLLGSE